MRLACRRAAEEVADLGRSVRRVAALTIISLLAALGLTFIPERWAGVLRLISLTLGVHTLALAIRAHSTGQRVLGYLMYRPEPAVLRTATHKFLSMDRNS